MVLINLEMPIIAVKPKIPRTLGSVYWQQNIIL